MPDELEELLRLVAEGKLSPEEAAPLVAELQPSAASGTSGAGGPAGEPRRDDTTGAAMRDAWSRAHDAWKQAADARERAGAAWEHADAERTRAKFVGFPIVRIGGPDEDRERARRERQDRRDDRRDARNERREADERPRPSARAALEGRRLRIRITEEGRSLINLQMPLAAAGAALDRIPGLSPDDRARIVQAIRSGMTGPILDVRDDDDEVLIVIE